MARRSRLLALGGAGMLALVLLGTKVAPWPARARPDAAPADAVLVGATEGRVRQVEPRMRVIHVAPSVVNFGAAAVTVTADTRIVVADAEGTFGDLREGTLVKVAYEVKSGIFLARTIEILKREGGDIAKPDVVKPVAATPERPAAAPPPVVREQQTAPAVPRGPQAPAARPPADRPARAIPAPAARPTPDNPAPAASAPAGPASAQAAPPAPRPQAAPQRRPAAAETTDPDPGAVIDWLLNQSRWRE